MKLNKIYSRMKNYAHFYTSNSFIFKKFSPAFFNCKVFDQIPKTNFM